MPRGITTVCAGMCATNVPTPFAARAGKQRFASRRHARSFSAIKIALGLTCHQRRPHLHMYQNNHEHVRTVRTVSPAKADTR